MPRSTLRGILVRSGAGLQQEVNDLKAELRSLREELELSAPIGNYTVVQVVKETYSVKARGPRGAQRLVESEEIKPIRRERVGEIEVK